MKKSVWNSIKRSTWSVMTRSTFNSKEENTQKNMETSLRIDKGFNVHSSLPASLLVLLLLLLSGCTASTSEDMDRIARPNNNAALLEGTWKIQSRTGNNNSSSGQARSNETIIGEKMGFSGPDMAFCGNYWNDVSYKVKKVNINEYFLHKNINMLNALKVEGDETLVITAYSQDKFLYEFVRLSNTNMVVEIDDLYYSMEKISEEANGIEGAVGTLKRPASDELQEKSQFVHSGLLLGIKTPVKTEDGIGDYSYRTYWISGINRSFMPVLSAKDIYLPRMDGFWRLKVVKGLGPEGTEDVLDASMVSKKWVRTPALIAGNYSKRVETKLRSAIMYVGNDYVCVENTVLETGQPKSAAAFKKTLRTLPVDNLFNTDGLKISDLAGENGTMAIDNAVSDLFKDSGGSSIEGLLKDSGRSIIENLDESELQESFALFRKTGHWFFKGRLNLNPAGQLPYMDFNLNLIPPENMVAYDILQVPWTEIKDKIPQAVDVYTSPNKDMAIILTRNSILLYAIEGRTLSAQPSVKLPLAEGSSVIMAEWAVEDYVLSWEKSFVKNNDIRIEEAVK